MPNDVFEAVLRGRARTIRAGLSERDRGEVDRLIALIELDPWIDGIYKFTLPVLPIFLTLYDNGTWRIAYRVVQNRFIEIYNIELIEDDE